MRVLFRRPRVSQNAVHGRVERKHTPLHYRAKHTWLHLYYGGRQAVRRTNGHDHECPIIPAVNIQTKNVFSLMKIKT